jgi:hypothetical protein
MKTQAWGWLVAGVLAAGLNASYHDGGLQWAHEVANRIEHSSTAVLALASGNAERFLSEARLVTERNETASCRLATSLARVQTRLARTETGFAHFDGMSARQEEQLARLEANRDRMEAQIEAQTARIRIPAVAFNPIVVREPQVSACPRIRVNVPQVPMVRIPAPEIDVESGNGPI